MAQNKLLVRIVILIAVVGAISFIGIRAPETVTSLVPEFLNDSQGESPGEQSAEKSIVVGPKQEAELAEEFSVTMVDKSTIGDVLAILKDVGEAAYYHFGLTEKDFLEIKKAGLDVIEGNFDICADDADVKFFLDSAKQAGLRVILNAGAGEAEWG